MPLANWISGRRLNDARQISTALAGDRGLKELLGKMTGPTTSLDEAIQGVFGYLLGKQLRPVLTEMFPPEASAALLFLSELSVPASVKGWIIRGAFADRVKSKTVAMAFVNMYRYSDAPLPGNDDSGDLPGPRIQLLRIFDEFDSADTLMTRLISLKKLDPAARSARTPEGLLKALLAPVT